ncbi:hypothetical protein [Fodinibius sp.]|uniref:hypothetical protein n=1 Tax=Fodinibius sp. TaxID=1872440 RepID=UPI002ACDF188|nr:hypothetical protein [Fodinibius sp.]MDZ7657772.1 hypothetical protein [Fodinibius sp.]
MKSSKKISHYSENKWDSWLTTLAEQEYFFVDNFIPDQLYKETQQYFQQLLDEREFNKAAIGTNQQRQIESNIRGDFIYWLDKQEDTKISSLFILFDEVLAKLREYLF